MGCLSNLSCDQFTNERGNWYYINITFPFCLLFDLKWYINSSVGSFEALMVPFSLFSLYYDSNEKPYNLEIFKY